MTDGDHGGEVSESTDGHGADKGHESKTAAAQEGADTAKAGTGGKNGDHLDAGEEGRDREVD